MEINIEQLIGYETEKKCPACGCNLIANKVGDEWCSDCAWANSQEMIDLAISLGCELPVKRPRGATWE